MALHTLGTNATTSLQCLAGWSAVLLSQADVASIAQGIVSDNLLAAIAGVSPGGIQAAMTTGSTHSNTTLDTLVTASGAPLSQIAVGDLVLGQDIVPGTYVARLISSTSVQLSIAATASNAGRRIIFVRGSAQRPGLSLVDGKLYIPGRGVLKVLPADVVAIDNTGWPILVSGEAIAYTGSQWSFT